jgi:hypothetical protein
MTLPQRVAHIVNHGMAALHPCVYGDLTARGAVSDIAADLQKEIALLCPDRDAKAIVDEFVAALPEVRRLVETDVDAAYDGDPAATSRMEVVMAYPGLYAVTVHRLAHVLGRRVLRQLKEHAHILTLAQGGKKLLQLRVLNGRYLVRLTAQVCGRGVENTGDFCELRVARLGFLLLPVLAERGAAVQGAGNKGLGDASRFEQRFKSVIVEQKDHPIFVHNE